MSVPSGPRTSKELVVAAWEHFDTEGQEKGDATSTGPPQNPFFLLAVQFSQRRSKLIKKL